MSAKKKSTHPHSSDFETTVSKLETLLQKMESSDVSLEESLQAFEQGIKLTREAQNTLATAEQRVSCLLDERGEPRETALGIAE